MKAICLLFVFSAMAVFAYAQPAYWQQQVDYTISVSLNDKDHSLDGYETIKYANNSPDTLHFIWMHVWMNAYKNDRTAFSEQLLENGSTKFYFSNEEDKGYTNRLAFKVNNSLAFTEGHPQHQDIIKIVLPNPLPPNKSCTIETPFHVQLPYNFSRGGHIGQAYQISQWYPKAAVYDRKGWHLLPYLDQGEFYSDFGNYEVSISLPENYTVAATGELTEGNNLADGNSQPATSTSDTKQKQGKPQQATLKNIPSSVKQKTITYKQNNVIDFAWFADKNFTVAKDTLLLPSGRIIQMAAYHLPSSEKNGYWKNAIKYLKKSVSLRSRLIGEYPYNHISVAEANLPYTGGMEYPTICIVSGINSAASLESVIDHEAGHNWFFGIIASNERQHPWMDEGMNTYYAHYRYKTAEQENASSQKLKLDFFDKRFDDEVNNLLLHWAISEQKGQPIETPSEKLSHINYELSAYYNASLWMKGLETKLGKALFDSCMSAYYQQWKFKHPYPEDFIATIQSVSKADLKTAEAMLTDKGYNGGSIKKEKSTTIDTKKTIKLSTFFNFKHNDQYKYIFVAPAVGYNQYDKLMLGALLHNYSIPQEKFSFLISPLYATGSQQLNGIARMEYKLHQGNNGEKLLLSIAGASFNGDSFTDSTGKKNFLRFSKIVPALRFVFANKNPRSQAFSYLQWKTFFIEEEGLLFTRDTIHQADIISYPTANRYVNQLKFVLENHRTLYPFDAQLQADQGKDFVRIAFTGNYFFNYPKGGGMNVRLFAGKFFYLGEKTFAKQFQTDAYQLNMTGPKGYEDYTYSNYFAGRNEFDGWASQQIMQRDGFFKVRTDFLSSKIGKTDNWLAAANFTTDFPSSFNPLSILPIKIPLKIFVDIGTYAEAWQKNSQQQKLIYDAGLQVSLFKNILHIYAPILYSKVYRDYIKSTNPGFAKNISFSIDIQNINIKKIFPQFWF